MVYVIVTEVSDILCYIRFPVGTLSALGLWHVVCIVYTMCYVHYVCCVYGMFVMYAVCVLYTVCVVYAVLAMSMYAV